MRARAFGCQKRTLASGADFDFHAVRISKIAGEFNGFRAAKADFVFLKRASRFFEKRSKNRLCKANIVRAARFLPVQREISPAQRIFFRAQRKISPVQSIFSVRNASFLCAEHLF